VVDALGGVVERIVVCELRENTFYASIHMDTPQGAVVIDARPSDAIALALRTDSKIFVEERVIQSAHSLERKSEQPMDIGKIQKWLEGLSEDELGKYKM
jgi:bifunctional DNase/RNase